MSTGEKVPLHVAQAEADVLVEKLAPHCERIEVAGSIRRKRPMVGDIEIVCIPKAVMAGLFGDEQERSPDFEAVVDGMEAVKGSPDGKYTQRITPLGTKLDLFMATFDNWGLILAIRTGSADFSGKILAHRWKQLGYTSIGGVLHRGGEQTYVREERDLFDMLGIEWVDPEDREVAR